MNGLGLGNLTGGGGLLMTAGIDGLITLPGVVFLIGVNFGKEGFTLSLGTHGTLGFLGTVTRLLPQSCVFFGGGGGGTQIIGGLGGTHLIGGLTGGLQITIGTFGFTGRIIFGGTGVLPPVVGGRITGGINGLVGLTGGVGTLITTGFLGGVTVREAE